MPAAQVPYVGYLSLGDDPHLVANECESCGALFFDRRNACANCGRCEFRLRPLANEGVLRAFTIVHRASPDVTVPYVSGIVDLDGGGVVKANIVGVDPDPASVTLGMKLRLTTFGVGTDSAGTQAVGFGYQPA
ncbi:MAG TPA: OB-fold domain-containing protein [Streptosporangiaceae bacterium]|nr:OB-fold domain-containing protein [Streptosporangiaceae bacterium]